MVPQLSDFTEEEQKFRTDSSIRSCVTTLPKRGSAAVNGLDQSLSGCVRNGVGSEEREGREGQRR